MIERLLKKARKYNVVRHIRGIKSRDFSLIASNCTGTLPYRFLNMPNLSPTINLYFHAPDYIKFVYNLEHYLSQPLRFVATSRYEHGREVHANCGRYPIGLIDDIEIHFMHYSSEKDVLEKWSRRVDRVNFDNLVFTFTDRDLCTPELMQKFCDLPARKKLMLTSRPMPTMPCALAVPACRGFSEINDVYTHFDALTHVNYQGLIDGVTPSASALKALNLQTHLTTDPALVRPVAL